MASCGDGTDTPWSIDFFGKCLRLVTRGLLFIVVAGLSMKAQEAIQPARDPSGIAPVDRGERSPQEQKGPHGSDVVAYWFGSKYHTPFVLKPGTGQAADIRRNSLEYTHARFWSLGSNLADIMVNQSDMAEPASNGGTGATEVYAILRSDIGLNEITHSSAFRFGPVRDAGMEVGANLEAKNSAYAPAERTIYFGPKLGFAMPRGYFTVGLHLRKEWNHEGVLGKAENYDPNFNLEPAWMLPFTIGRMHLAYSGFADYNTGKGKDSFGTPTAAEFLIRSAVNVDVGAALFRRSQLLDLSGGLWYWHNEYGKPSSVPGATQTTPMVGLAVHLDGGRPVRGR